MRPRARHDPYLQMRTYLDFEKPIAELESKVAELTIPVDLTIFSSWVILGLTNYTFGLNCLYKKEEFWQSIYQ